MEAEDDQRVNNFGKDWSIVAEFEDGRREP